MQRTCIPLFLIMAQTVCDVCYYVDGDSSIKDTGYCGFCDANICAACQPKLGKRAQAMKIRAMKKVANGFIGNLFRSEPKHD